MESDPFERLDYSSQVDWSDEEPEVPTESTLMEVSEETKRFLVDKCMRGVAMRPDEGPGVGALC